VSLRILHIIDSLEPSDAAQQLLWLVRGLAEQGIDVHVCVLGRGGSLLAEFRSAGLPTPVIGRRWRVDPLAYRRLTQHLARLRPDVVHTWDHLSGVYGRLAAKKVSGTYFRTPPTDHVPPLLRRNRFLTPFSVAGMSRVDPWRGPLGWLIERRLTPATDRFLVPHTGVRDWCIGYGLPEERFVVVPGGAPPARTSDVSRDQLLGDLKLPADARLIGVIDRLVPENRLKDLIWAADLVRVLHDNLRLLVIGDGPERPQLERFARLASDLEHIRFLGERSDLWRIVPHLDVLWNGSEQAGYATAVMDAMAAGVPVVASDVPGHRDLVVHGETGFLVPIDDRAAWARTTDRLLTGADLAARLGTAARERVLGQFSIGQFVRRHVELYQRLAG
jgi:glycosyltransferase involved in cell wall biosynthesis